MSKWPDHPSVHSVKPYTGWSEFVRAVTAAEREPEIIGLLHQGIRVPPDEGQDPIAAHLERIAFYRAWAMMQLGGDVSKAATHAFVKTVYRLHETIKNPTWDIVNQRVFEFLAEPPQVARQKPLCGEISEYLKRYFSIWHSFRWEERDCYGRRLEPRFAGFPHFEACSKSLVTALARWGLAGYLVIVQDWKELPDILAEALEPAGIHSTRVPETRWERPLGFKLFDEMHIVEMGAARDRAHAAILCLLAAQGRLKIERDMPN